MMTRTCAVCVVLDGYGDGVCCSVWSGASCRMCGVRLRASISLPCISPVFYFFFQAEDGIRDLTVTGVQTCALPISLFYGRKSCRTVIEHAGEHQCDDAWPVADGGRTNQRIDRGARHILARAAPKAEIGRASCRERV